MAGLWPAGWKEAPGIAPASTQPLLLTVALPSGLQAAADTTRRRLDPDSAARTPAHLTLFRHLPGPQGGALVRDIRALLSEMAAPEFRLEPPRRRGDALMVPIRSEALDALRADLARRWHGLLAPGDMAPPALHITLAGPRAGARAEPRPPPLPAGPWRAPGLLLWRHSAGGLPGGRGEAFWTPLVALAFRR